MVAAVNTEAVLHSSNWPLVNAFLVLGHTLQPDGSIRECWAKAGSAMWRAFWGNSGYKDAAWFPVEDRLALLRTTVLPQIDFGCSRWPPQRLQQKMTATLLKEPFRNGERVEEYVRRRGRLAKKPCRDSGVWSNHWFRRVCKLDDHLARAHDKQSWAAKLRDYRGKEWLMMRRAQFVPANPAILIVVSALAGRTNTREFRGQVQARWHDGVSHARIILSL